MRALGVMRGATTAPITPTAASTHHACRKTVWAAWPVAGFPRTATRMQTPSTVPISRRFVDHGAAGCGLARGQVGGRGGEDRRQRQPDPCAADQRAEQHRRCPVRMDRDGQGCVEAADAVHQASCRDDVTERNPVQAGPVRDHCEDRNHGRTDHDGEAGPGTPSSPTCGAAGCSRAALRANGTENNRAVASAQANARTLSRAGVGRRRGGGVKLTKTRAERDEGRDPGGVDPRVTGQPSPGPAEPQGRAPMARRSECAPRPSGSRLTSWSGDGGRATVATKRRSRPGRDQEHPLATTPRRAGPADDRAQGGGKCAACRPDPHRAGAMRRWAGDGRAPELEGVGGAAHRWTVAGIRNATSHQTPWAAALAALAAVNSAQPEHEGALAAGPGRGDPPGRNQQRRIEDRVGVGGSTTGRRAGRLRSRGRCRRTPR